MITSTANPTIKFIRKLADRKERLQTGLFFVEGLRIVGEALQKGWEVEILVVAPELLTSLFGQQLVAEYVDKHGRVDEVSADVFRSLSLKDGPQGIGAVVRQRWATLDDVHLRAGDTWIALDSVQDPGNLGTILRTSDSAGCRGVILLDQSTDPFDPGTVRASMGAVFSQPLIKTSLPAFASWKKSEGAAVIGTSDKAHQDYHRFIYPEGLVLLMGSERQGLQEQHLSLCSGVISIPMQGESDSLNLAVATALVVYEILNQRRDQGIAQPKP
ncbi:MAG TPA: RNA methyltransferase [Bellilinea sp.]|nr:RNA methyltransferase [Bellilinea sp.]